MSADALARGALVGRSRAVKVDVVASWGAASSAPTIAARGRIYSVTLVGGIGGVVGIFQGDVVGGLVFGYDFLGLCGLGFQDEDFDIVGAFGLFRDWEGVGGDGAGGLDAVALQQAADYQGLRGVFRDVGDDNFFVGVLLGHFGAPEKQCDSTIVRFPVLGPY